MERFSRSRVLTTYQFCSGHSHVFVFLLIIMLLHEVLGIVMKGFGFFGGNPSFAGEPDGFDSFDLLTSALCRNLPK